MFRQYIKRIIYSNQVKINIGMQDYFHIQKSIREIHCINSLKILKHMTILTDMKIIEKKLIFITKIISKLRLEENFYQKRKKNT